MDIVAQRIMQLLLTRFNTTTARMKRALIARFAKADSYQHVRDLIPHLRSLDDVPLELIETVEAACTENSQIRDNHELGKVEQLIGRWRDELSNGS